MSLTHKLGELFREFVAANKIKEVFNKNEMIVSFKIYIMTINTVKTRAITRLVNQVQSGEWNTEIEDLVSKLPLNDPGQNSNEPVAYESEGEDPANEPSQLSPIIEENDLENHSNGSEILVEHLEEGEEETSELDITGDDLIDQEYMNAEADAIIESYRLQF